MCPYRRYRVKPKPFGVVQPHGVYIGLLREWESLILENGYHHYHPNLCGLLARTKKVLAR